MVFINFTESIGIILLNGTEATTGNLFITLLFVLIFVMAIAMMFGIATEYTTIIIFPLLLGYMSYYEAYTTIGALFIIYMAFLVTKNWLFK